MSEPPKESTRDLADAEQSLRARFEIIRLRWKSHFPEWELRPIAVYRSVADQQKAFASGNSRIDGVKKKGEHNHYPSRAIDAGIFRKTDGAWIDTLLEKKLVTIEQYRGMYAVYGLLAQSQGLRWGNDWNGNGIAVGPDPAESLVDAYHVELKKES